MLKVRFLAPVFAGVCFVSAQAQYADRVVAYTPGSGVSSFTNAAAALGQPSRANPFGEATDPFDPPYGTNQIVGVGAGGSLTVHLGTPAVSDPFHPFGVDFLIFGHAGFTITNNDFSGGGVTDGSMFGNNAGPTRVSVSQDGVTYYVLNPSLAPTVDSLFPTDGSGDFTLPVNPTLTTRDFAGNTLSDLRGLYAGSGGGTGFAIAWAQDTNGHSVFLPSINFVRVEVLSGKSEIDAFSVVTAPASFQESFAADPAADGWQTFGNTNLFQWDQTNQNLQVTWDSSQVNSYFYHPLGTILTRQDDFKVALDLFLTDVAAGVNPAKPSTFQLALGFQDVNQATQANFLRASGTNSANLVELDFFPDTGFGPTLWPGIWATNSLLNYNGSTDYTTVALPVGLTMHVTMSYTASNQTLVTTITTNGVTFGPINHVKLSTNFTDFHVNTFAIESYNDAGQDPHYGGSLLAHGTVDNLEIIAPRPPVPTLAIALSNGAVQVRFNARTNWLYTLERTTDFQSWIGVSPAAVGTGGLLSLSDPNIGVGKAFYRVRAERP